MIHCYICNQITKSVEPFVIKRIDDKISLLCLCEKCGLTKGRFMTSYEQNMLPFKVYHLPPKKSYINKFVCSGIVYHLNDCIGRMNELI
jgi:hypothetical protein